jgi:cytochrome c oxidase cbb3-type subunit IV
MNQQMQAWTGIVQGLMAGILLLMFLGLWMWVYSGRRRAGYDSASQLPLEEDHVQDEAI